jgi:uncharacterized protein YodC (DUF2158 family)
MNINPTFCLVHGPIFDVEKGCQTCRKEPLAWTQSAVEGSGPKEAALDVGDKVQLLSGGPRMTVIERSTVGDSVRCAWFPQGAARPERESFPARSLRKVS